jgi:hypothetical protein
LTVELRDLTIERMGELVDLDAKPIKSGQGYRARGTLVVAGSGAQDRNVLAVLRRHTTIPGSPSEVATDLVALERGTGSLDIVTVASPQSPPQFRWEILGVAELTHSTLVTKSGATK